MRVPPLYWVDKNAIHHKAEMQVITGCKTCLTGNANCISLVDELTNFCINPALMSIYGIEALPIIKNYCSAVNSKILGKDNLASIGGLDRRPGQ